MVGKMCWEWWDERYSFGENESVKFRATMLNSLKNRGVEDIFIACTDNLTGCDAVIHATFPQTEIQNCIIR